MKILRALALATTLGLASAAFAQSTTPPESPDPQTTPSPDPNAASSPHQRDVTSQPGTESSPSQSPEPESASTPHQKGAVGATPNTGMTGAASPKIVGLEVESPGGEALGAVIDMVVDANKEPAYVIISTGNDTATAVPYAAVSPMIRDNKVVLDRTRLENSPQVTQGDVHDKANTKWRTQADRYWGAGTIRSASPNDPKQPKER